MTGELTLLVLRLLFLAVMWIFVFSIIYSMRSDLFGSKSRDYQQALEQSRQQTFGGASASAAQDAPAPAPAPVPAAAGSRPAPAPAPAPASAPSPQQQAPSPAFRKLVITSGPKRGTELELGEGPVSIGRAADSDLVIQDDYTSTRHARLLNWGERWMVQDLDSTNGTYVDDQRIGQPTEVRSGSAVRIGTTTFELR